MLTHSYLSVFAESTQLIYADIPNEVYSKRQMVVKVYCRLRQLVSYSSVAEFG